jgi:hypothetical protein
MYQDRMVMSPAGAAFAAATAGAGASSAATPAVASDLHPSAAGLGRLPSAAGAAAEASLGAGPDILDDGTKARIHFVHAKDDQMHTDVVAPTNSASIF